MQIEIGRVAVIVRALLKIDAVCAHWDCGFCWNNCRGRCAQTAAFRDSRSVQVLAAWRTSTLANGPTKDASAASTCSSVAASQPLTGPEPGCDPEAPEPGRAAAGEGAPGRATITVVAV